MFFIFGWNHTKITDCGPVQEETCNHCHNKEIWQLKKISKYFTLFFIPIFPHDSESLYLCPICNHGIKLDNEQYKDYNEIAQINTDCLQHVITEEEREIKLEAVKKRMSERIKTEDLKNQESSLKWSEMVAQKSSEELEKILNYKRTEYDPAYIVAAEKELNKRKTS